jgi:spore germination protein YaaH
MAYDFHRPSSDTAGPVSPIDGKGVHAEYDIRTMIQDYMKRSDPRKLIMGVPYYGYNWVVTEPTEYAQRIPGNDYIGYSQSQTYSMIMDTIIDINPVVYWDELGKVPYYSYVSNNTGSIREVYFENLDSLKIKYDLVKQNNMGGVGIWALGYDGGYQELWNLLDQEFFN